VSVDDLSDESLLRYYDSLRKQVEADRGNTHKFMTSDTIKQYAEALRLELYKRRLAHAPIDWWTDRKTDIVVTSNRLTDPLEVKANELAEAANIDFRDSAEQLTHLQSRIDALIKGSDQIS
jgi:hypothetical protein